MKILKTLGEIIGPNDPELVEKTLARLNEQDRWNDVFSTKPIELLDKIDRIKGEIRERLRDADKRIQKAEEVTQSESLLLAKASEFGDASSRLELAQTAEQKASALAVDAKHQLEKANATLQDAQQKAADANAAEQRASVLALDAKRELDKATGALEGARQMAVEARNLAKDANEKLRSAQQAELDANEKLRLAQEAELKAARQSRLALAFAALAVTLSWSAMGWAAWFMVRTRPLFWLAVALSILIAIAVPLVGKGVRSDA